MDQARAAWRRALEMTDADRERGFQALRSHDATTAQGMFDAVLRRSPNDVSAIAGLGFIRLEQKRFADALTLFDRARTLAPSRADVREGYDTARYWSEMERGEFLESRDADAALAAYETALAIRPYDEGALLATAQLLLRRGHVPGARERFEQVLRRSPDNADAIAGLGFVHLDEKQFEEAAGLLARALALDPGRADVEEAHDAARLWGLMTRASTALDQDQTDAAMTAFEQALVLDPAAADALLGLAGAAERARDDAVAAKAYARLTAADPGDVRGWLGLIRVQTGAGDPAAVLRTAHRIPAAVQRQLEERSDHLARLSLALFGTGQRSAGKDMLRRALYAAARDDSAEALSVRLQTAALLMDNRTSSSRLRSTHMPRKLIRTT